MGAGFASAHIGERDVSDLAFHSVDHGECPRHCMIWLHGLGADGCDLAPLAEELRPPLPTRFVFPHAPRRPVSIHEGLPMPAWYDIFSPAIHHQQDRKGIEHSARRIQGLIDALQAEGFAASRMLLAGFSQGGAMAAYCALRQRTPLAGLIALSCYRLLPEQGALASPIPAFVAYGQMDDIVPATLGKGLAQGLRGQGYQVLERAYPVGHGICPQELQDIRQWLEDIGFWKGEPGG